MIGLKKMKSRFFGAGSAPPPATATPNLSSNSRKGVGGPPPMPASRALRIEAPVQRHIQKPQPQKRPIPVSYVTNAMIRELRELIRYRYALDCKIWSIGKKVKSYQRDTVEADMRRSDAALSTIKGILNSWDRQEYFATQEQFERFREIKDRILRANTRTWATHPPWIKHDPAAQFGVYEKDGRPIHYIPRSSMSSHLSSHLPSESSSSSRYA
jgi:hypothetical protein